MGSLARYIVAFALIGADFTNNAVNAATLTINGRTVSVLGGHQEFTKEAGRDPGSVPRMSVCNSLDFDPENCGIFFGHRMIDPAEKLRNALKQSIITTQEMQPQENGVSRPPETPPTGVPLPPSGMDGVSARDASMHAAASAAATTSTSHNAHDGNSVNAADAPQPPSTTDSAGGRNGGLSFVLDELFGGPYVGATEKAKQLKMLIMGGARIHGGSIKVIRGMDGGRQQVIHVGLTSEILLRLIELAEKGIVMKEALSIITQSIADSNKEAAAIMHPSSSDHQHNNEAVESAPQQHHLPSTTPNEHSSHIEKTEEQQHQHQHQHQHPDNAGSGFDNHDNQEEQLTSEERVVHHGAP
mmetsp:Transcript_11200/g.18290  ORF Transcript_11200/g.18290 Transcript_11200/m.18290 type:complete len:356 (+) Transcript_11200:83-1150(+)